MKRGIHTGNPSPPQKGAHPVDDLIKGALQTYRASPGTDERQRFIDEGNRLFHSRRKSKKWWFFATGLTLTVTLTAIMLCILPEAPENLLPESPKNLLPEISSGNAMPAGSPVPSSHTATKAVETTSSIAKPPENKAIKTCTALRTTDSHAISSETIISHSVTSTNSITSAVASILPASPVTRLPSLPAPLPLGVQPVLPYIARDTGVCMTSIPDTTKPGISEGKQQRLRSAKKWNYSLSGYYGPEWMFNTLEGTKYIHNFGLEGTLRHGKYILRMGAGLSINTGAYELLVEYNDYMGSYSHLDSILFDWDENHYHLLPTYYTSQQDVWDSLLKADYPRIEKRYTYLQIPLMLGYDLIQKERYSFGFRAGQILSLLISSKQLTPAYDPMKNKIIQVNNISVDRIESNWQIVAGVNFSWHLSKRITLEIEPMARYYFTSVYEKSDLSKKVFSLGFRTAITFQK